MNAAARSLEQGNLFYGNVSKFQLSARALLFGFLFSAVLASAVAVVYLKNVERCFFSDLQALQQQQHRLQVEKGQLLLEQSTWATPVRVQRAVKTRLKMKTPRAHEVVTLKL